MTTENMEILIDKWMNEISFRDEVRQDPQAAIERAGLHLNEEDKEALQQIDWKASDEELQARISKAG